MSGEDDPLVLGGEYIYMEDPCDALDAPDGDFQLPFYESPIAGEEHLSDELEVAHALLQLSAIEHDLLSLPTTPYPDFEQSEVFTTTDPEQMADSLMHAAESVQDLGMRFLSSTVKKSAT